ncbi:MAG TPA: FxLYD domain-containing protein [Dehalococcoidia bacterium]|nr:FxLYD domain-containing protein [Dehalococcoidia bacterium]
MRFIVAAVLTCALALTLLIAGGSSAHPGHPEKKLFDSRWYHQATNGDYGPWMTLSTSDVWLDCDATEASCRGKWQAPFDAAMTDWNSRATTTRFAYTRGVRSEAMDVNVAIEDTIAGQPGLLGIAVPLDDTGQPCFDCPIVYQSVVLVADDWHLGPFATSNERRGTIAHELGHVLSLRHESVNADESIQYPCGEDDTGPIPHSVMSYNCIDPPSYNSGQGPGHGEYWVQDWDVCGVNHAYYDPTIGYAGCGVPEPTGTPTHTATPTPPTTPTATPTATPTPPPGQQGTMGDVDCANGVNSVDALKVLRFVANLSVSQNGQCDPLNTGGPPVQGDVDCQNGVNSVDALKVLRFVANLSVSQSNNCPHIGTPRGGSSSTPTWTGLPQTQTPAPTATPTSSPAPTPTPTTSSTPTPTPTPTPTSTPTPTPSRTPTPTPTPSRTPTPSPTPGGQVTTRKSTWHYDILGAIWVNGEVYNGLSVPVGLVEVTANFYSANNTLLATDTGFACLESIASGGDSPYDVLLFSPPVGIDHVTVGVTDYFTPPFYVIHYPPVNLNPTVTNTYIDAINYLHLVGNVQNSSSNTYDFVEVCAAFYDSQGNVVDTNFDYTSPDTLGPGATGTFDTDGDADLGVSGYRVWADGDW